MKNSNNFLKLIVVVFFIVTATMYAQKEFVQNVNEHHKTVAYACTNSSGEVFAYSGKCVLGNGSCSDKACPSN